MDEYYDDEYEEEFLNKKPKNKKITTNPNGPYTFEIKFKGYDYKVIIKNVSFEDFKVKVTLLNPDEETENFDEEQEMLLLKKYIQDEGFLVAAKKWNLYY